ncbi:regulator of G-protein signaling 21 [Pseudophryne corroboree]|uniref:regulator of G-protein signaling 21 n=1 Tax=Pseudophryne corroboree TaxID=495146 RepID=UPI00308208BC
MECYESMGKLLANKDGLAAFRDFLKSEFSDENIEFWLACEDFKKTKTSSQLALKANKIYCEYIKTESPREVNIDHKTRDIISQKIIHPTTNCFDDAQELISCLMAKDSFPRFLRSEHYKELVKKQQSNEHKRWLSF